MGIGRAIAGGRFIPAPAGNIPPKKETARARSVHPRACGEHVQCQRPKPNRDGSSPRLRGTCTSDGYQHFYTRFIPAPAGNIFIRIISTVPRAVHPRACGEHGWPRLAASLPSGSSPRLRGTFAHVHGGARAGRFIPAPAGNIRIGQVSGRVAPVHPRACGEHENIDGRAKTLIGSSPRLRGTSSGTRERKYRLRFIPAPAGNII